MKIKTFLSLAFLLLTQFVMAQDDRARYTDSFDNETEPIKFGWPLFIIIVIVAIIITKVKAKK